MSAESDWIKRLSQKFEIPIPRELIRQEVTKQYTDGALRFPQGLSINFNYDKRKLDFLEAFIFDNIKGMTEELSDRFRKELTIAVLNNESVSQIKQRVKDILEVGETRAKMIARTELARAYNAGTLDAAQQSRAQTRKWLSITYDDRTTDVSKAMGEKYGSKEKAIDMDEMFSVAVNGKTYEGLAPPFMPNDRDRLMITFVVKEKDL